MTYWIKNIWRWLFWVLLRRLPFKKALLSYAALAPVQFKSKITHWIFERISAAYKSNETEYLTTNLGISNRCRVRLPLYKAPFVYMFGLPRFYEGEYGALLLSSYLSKYCQCFIDIGSNWGYYQYFLRFNGSTIPIHFVEPNKMLYETNLDNNRVNGLSGIQGYNLAIGNTTGKMKFYLDESDYSMSSLLDNYKANHQLVESEVEVFTFDRFMEKNNIQAEALVKVDVENAEFLFVEGAQKSLVAIQYLIIELLGPARERGIVNRLIHEYGFSCYYINHLNLEHVDSDDGRYTHPEFNWLFCHDSPEQLKRLLRGTPMKVID